MSLAVMSTVLLIMMFVLLGSGLWIAMTLIMVGFLAMFLFTDSSIGPVLTTSVWSSSYSWSMCALPLFIWMGEILFRSRLSDSMFESLSHWMTRLPGGLVHVNIVACSIFAAVSGSSTATAATIGKISLPELRKRGYDESISQGSLAGAGTLGLLIPPSIIMIVYGVAAEQSIARLFIAGVIPGIVLAGLFMLYIMGWSLANPGKVPPVVPSNLNFFQRVYNLRHVMPTVMLIIGIMGSIYFGVASPTDAAAVGVALALLLCAITGDLNWKMFVDSVMGAIRTSCMISFILLGASFLTTAMGFTGIPIGLAMWIKEMQLSPFMVISALTVLFVILGCFLDGVSIVVLTTAVILPMVQASGFDLIWFGIYLVVVVEMSAVTPPVGFNLFIIQGLTGTDLFEVARSTIPFFLLMVLMVAILVVWPGLATYLPNTMMQRS